MEYEYNIWGSRYGGEHTIGTIPLKTAIYWLKKGEDAFEEYMFSGYWDDDKDELNNDIPEEHQIEEMWHDLDDVDHICSVEFESSNVLVVEDAKTGKTVAEIEMTEDKLGSVCDPLSLLTYDDDGDLIDPDTGEMMNLVYGQSFEKGGFNFETIKTNEPFDASKLKFNITTWSTMKLVHAVEYDGEDYGAEGGDTIGKSMSMWIDD